jgi:hypothetical protein
MIPPNVRFLALNGHSGHAQQCLLLGVKRTSDLTSAMSAFDA